MKVEARFHQDSELIRFLRKLEGPEMQRAAARGLNEHAGEQMRQSVVRITTSTGVPAGRVRSKTRVVKAAPGASMMAEVVTADVAIPLAEYGNPVWIRDLNPMADGQRGGSVSSMRGAEATGWNVRRQFPHSFIAGGQVVVRKTDSRFPLKVLSMAVLANELAKPTRPNVPASERFAALDLEKRIVRHVVRRSGLRMAKKPGRKPTGKSAIPPSCSRSDLALLLGISIRAVADWDLKGVFTKAQGRGRYETVASVNGYISSLRESAAGRASTTGQTLTDERAQTERVVRQIKERELAKLLGETLTVAEVSESWSLFAGAVKAAVLSIPGKARSSIPHLTAHDGDVLKHMIRDVLMDLAEEVEATVVGGNAEEIARVA